MRCVHASMASFFDTVIVPRSKRFWLLLEDETLAAAGIAVGDEVKIDLEPIAGPV